MMDCPRCNEPGGFHSGVCHTYDSIPENLRGPVSRQDFLLWLKYREQRKAEFLFYQASLVAQEATCKQARCGSVLISANGDVIGTGFNAPPLGNEAHRQCDNIPDTSRKPKSDVTCCVHAEWNAILNALRDNSDKVKGSTLYFMRVDEEGKFTDAGEPYCTVCSRLALQSGVKSFGLWNKGPEMWTTEAYNKKSYEYFQ